MIITPGGMGSKNLSAWEAAIDKTGFTRVGKSVTRHGDVYIAEKYMDGAWRVWWCARDMACQLECDKHSAQNDRIKAARDHALQNLVLREGVVGEFGRA